MAVTEAQARRATRRADFNWDAGVKDPRSDRNQVHGHHGILSVMAMAFACGLLRLRRVEDFSEDLDPVARRRLGLPRRVSDSTFYRVLADQAPAGLRETVYAQVRDFIDRKVIRSDDLFPFGVMSFDGKCFWSSVSDGLDGAKVSEDPNTGTVTSSLTKLGAVLTSSSIRPCVDLEFILAKSGESPAFRTLFPRVCAEFGGQFEIITVDAGMTCLENAKVIIGKKKQFLMSLKGNQPTLHQLAEHAFADPERGLRAHTSERRNGCLVFRELDTIKVEDLPEDASFFGAVELWCVRQTSTPMEDSSAKATRETFYFLSSMQSGFLTPIQKLALVRLHWGCENNHHWTLDVPLEEDDIQPCQANLNALEVVAWLRILSYNLLSAWRAGQPEKDGRPPSWARTMELLRDALLHASLHRYTATLA